MNMPIPLFPLLAARQANDSPADTARIALVSMLVRPAMLGLLLAVVMAKQASQARAVQAGSATSGSASGGSASKGRMVFDQVAPESDLHSFLPSFVGFTRKQAQEFAKELRLNPQFSEDQTDTP